MSSEEQILECTVLQRSAGQRIDKFLASVCDELSRARLQALISAGNVTRNGTILKATSFKVEEGDIILVHVPAPEPAEPEAEDIPIDVVYEDNDVLVLNKPAGLVVHPGAGNWSGTLVNALLFHCRDCLSGIGGVLRPGIVHRLDKDTSGLMMVAKNDHAHKHLSEQLANRTLKRVYHALVLGVPLPLKGKIDKPIGRHRNNRLKMSVISNSPKEACTHYRNISNFNDVFALVECRLDTGRTHQIRVHMEDYGCPIIGDPLYSPQPTGVKSACKNGGYGVELFSEISNLSRQMLHAQEIEFVHPSTEEPCRFTCDKPSDFSNILKILDKK